MSSESINILSRDEIERYLRQMSTIFGSRCPSFQNMTICQSCLRCPDVVRERSDPNRGWLVTFECKTCPLIWCLCKECDADDQPNQPHLGTKRLSSQHRHDTLKNNIQEHHEKHHLRLATSTTQFDYSQDDDEGILDFHDHVETDNSQVAEVDLTIELSRADIYSPTDLRLTSDLKYHFMDVIVSVLTNKSVAEYLIKKFWVKNQDVNLSVADCDLFLKISRELLLSSRDSNKRFMSIIHKVQERHKTLSIQITEENLSLKQQLQSALTSLTKANNVLQRVAANSPQMRNLISSSIGYIFDSNSTQINLLSDTGDRQLNNSSDVVSFIFDFAQT